MYTVCMNETRNLIDYYHYWNHDAIIADLETRRHNFSVVCCNIGNDFNIATVIRNANAFLAREVAVYGNRKYDRRGTVGTHHYTNFRHVRDISSLSDYLDMLRMSMVDKNMGFKVIGVDNVPEAKDVNAYEFDSNHHYVFVFGQEQIGVPSDVLNICDDVLYIPQYGSVRSINVGCASSIIMNNYCAKVHSSVV